jgi:hypothetical protein
VQPQNPPLPPFELKKEELVPNQKSRTHRLIPRQQDFGIRNWTLSYETACGSHFGIFLLVNLGGLPLLLPPPSLAAWKFLGYYSIFFVSSGIALFGSPDCPQTTLDKAAAFMKDLQGTFHAITFN